MVIYIYIVCIPSVSTLLIGVTAAVPLIRTKSCIFTSIFSQIVPSTSQQEKPSCTRYACFYKLLGLLEEVWETCCCDIDEVLCRGWQFLDVRHINHLLEVYLHSLDSSPATSSANDFRVFAGVQKVTGASWPQRGQVKSALPA